MFDDKDTHPSFYHDVFLCVNDSFVLRWTESSPLYSITQWPLDDSLSTNDHLDNGFTVVVVNIQQKLTAQRTPRVFRDFYNWQAYKSCTISPRKERKLGWKSKDGGMRCQQKKQTDSSKKDRGEKNITQYVMGSNE